MLGFDIYKFFFSMLNFFVLFFLMKKLFFKPILNILAERKAKIASELGKVDEAKAEIAQLRVNANQIIAQAKQEAQMVIKNATKNADELIARSKSEADKLIQETRDSIEREREEIRREIYATLVDLVSFAARKVMTETISEEHQRDLIESAVGQSLKQSYFRGMVN